MKTGLTRSLHDGKRDAGMFGPHDLDLWWKMKFLDSLLKKVRNTFRVNCYNISYDNVCESGRRLIVYLH